MDSDSPARLLHFVIGFMVGAPLGVWLGGKVVGGVVGCPTGVLAFLFLDRIVEALVDRFTGGEDQP